MATPISTICSIQSIGSCSICSAPFTDPRLLPCLHVYCKSCLESLQSESEGSVLTCPSCYRTTTQPSALLPKHIKLERDVCLSKVKKPGETTCGTCDDNNKAEAYCEDCSAPICADCVGSHNKLKPLKGHNVGPLESTKPQPPPSTCGVHPKESLKHYCSKCKSLICNECLLDHKYHKWITIDEAASSEREKLKQLLPKIEKSMPPITKAIGMIDGNIGVVDENEVKAKEEIDKAFNELAAAVERRRDELLKQLEDAAIAEKTRLEMQKEELKGITKGLSLALATASSACTDDYSGIEMLAVKGAIEQATDVILRDIGSSSLVPVCNGGPELAIHISSCIDDILLMGRVHTLSQYPPLCSLIDVNPESPIGVSTDCDCLLILQTRNNRGEELEEGGANVKAMLKKKSVFKTVVESHTCEVRDLDNGKYEILISSSRFLSGIYELQVTVNNFQAEGSPYVLWCLDYRRLKRPRHILPTAVSPEYIDYVGNHFYVSTRQGNIEIYEHFGSGNTWIKKREIPTAKLGGANQLRGIAVDGEKGVLFVASSGANCVIKADLNGNVITTVGGNRSWGRGQLTFKYPTGLCLSKEGLLLVGDCGNQRVQVLGPDMSFIRFIKSRAKVWGVSVDPGGNVHVGTTDCVEVFNMDGMKITEYGQRYLEKAGDIQFPNFQKPSECKYSFVSNCIDEGEIYFYNWTTDTLLHTFEADDHPLGIRIDQAGDLHICCFENRKLLSF